MYQHLKLYGLTTQNCFLLVTSFVFRPGNEASHVNLQVTNSKLSCETTKYGSRLFKNPMCIASFRPGNEANLCSTFRNLGAKLEFFPCVGNTIHRMPVATFFFFWSVSAGRTALLVIISVRWLTLGKSGQLSSEFKVHLSAQPNNCSLVPRPRPLTRKKRVW